MYKKGCEPEALNVSSGGSGTEPPAECKGNDRFEGYCMDLLKLLAERCCKSTVYLPSFYSQRFGLLIFFYSG